MEQIFIAIMLGVLGLLLGSFAGATVWRLRARQLVYDKAHGEKVDSKEYKKLKPLTEAKVTKDRSRCLHCGYELKWYDLIPLFSWLSLRGRCRSCRKPIGKFEPLIELGMAGLFVLSYLLWPFPLETALGVTALVVWLAACVVLVIAFAYDSKWFLLPDITTIILIALGVIAVVINILLTGNVWGGILNAAGAVAILSGLYLVLYLISGGRWIGFGDVKLGIGLGLILGDWQLALLALFLANFIGCLIVIPFMIAGKVTGKTQVPFGPLLIAGTILAKLIGFAVIDWYTSLIF